MTVVTITREAKCKDCKFCKSIRTTTKKDELSRRNTYECNNAGSPRSFRQISPNDLVCPKWELT